MTPCNCRCHGGPSALDRAPELDDPVGTVTACSKCRRRHYPPPPPSPIPSAGGHTYDPTGDCD